MTTYLPRLPLVEPDDLPVWDIQPHTIEKYRRVWYYDQLFATGMKNEWDQRFYVDLFSGPGRASLHGTLVPTSPMLALNIPDRFTRYVYCEQDPELLEGLQRRVERFAPDVDARFILGDVNANVDQILEHIRWPYGSRALTFFFVDPLRLADLPFETIQRLATERFGDFFILIPTGMDATRNFDRNYLRPENTIVDRFLGRDDWREEFYREVGESPAYFLLRKYSERMEGLGFLPCPPEKVIAVKHHEKNFPLYHLAFFSRNERGWEFYEKMKKGTADQGELNLGDA